jgi:hypothetical protein
LRHKIMAANGWSLRQLYRTLETPGANRLRDAHAALDSAVRSAYGMKDAEDTLAFLPRLNLALAGREAEGEKITPPGLPALLPSFGDFISVDCIRAPTTTPHLAGGGGDQLQSRSAI